MMTQMFDKWIEEREDPLKSAAVAEGESKGYLSFYGFFFNRFV